MKNLRYKLGVLAAVLVVVSIGASFAADRRHSAEAGTVAAQPVIASSEVVYDHVGATLAPPSSTNAFSPLVSGSDAAKIAIAGSSGSVVSIVGGLYSNEQALTDEGKIRFEDVAAWMVTVDGICSPYWGPHPESDGPCYYALRHVVVDAQTGAVIENFS